jgi:nascent polypeptide-associated complex subunit alpha
MFGGGGGLNPRKMQKMMEQMGIDLKELDAESAVIRLTDGTELVFDGPDVTRMDARGQETYQVVGSPEARAGETGGGDELEGETADADADDAGIPDDDVALVADQAGASEADAREALEATDGDLASAIDRLS